MRLKDIRMLPARITRIPEIDELLNAEQAELDYIAIVLADIIAQSSINSATHTLSRYEKIFDVSYQRGATTDERRTALILKFLARYPMTVKLMEELVLFITGCKNEITEFYADYAFKITMFGDAENARYRLLKEHIELMKPAHLGCLYLVIMDVFEIIAKSDMLSRVAYRSSFGGRLGVSSMLWDSGDYWDVGHQWDDETKQYIKARMALRQQIKYLPIINRYWDGSISWDSANTWDNVYGMDMLSRLVFRVNPARMDAQTGGAVYTDRATHKWDKAYTWDGNFNWDSSSIVNQAAL